MAQDIFLYGTLRHVPLLELIGGRDAGDLKLRDAVLADYAVYWAEAPGILLSDVDETLKARLDFYELGFGYRLGQVELRVGDEMRPAQVYFPDPGLWQAGAPWSLDDWVRDWWPVTRHSAAEVMSYMGVLSGGEVAARFGMIMTRAASKAAAEGAVAPCTVRGAMGSGSVDLLSTETTHAGFFLMQALHLRHPLFRGGMSEEIRREIFVAGDAAIILPYDPVRDRVMLVEQVRMGPYGRGDGRPWVLEPVAGRIDGGETPEDAARRETAEEAGLSLSRLEKIAAYYPTPGYSTEYFHSFLGIADLPDGCEGFGGLESEQEDIRAHVLGFEAAMALVESGEANIGPLILSLLWLSRERDRLRAEAVG